jgi:hypothetical protein
MVKFTSLNLEKNQEIFVATAQGKYSGKFNRLWQNGTRLEIVDVKDEDGKPSCRFKNFHEGEKDLTITFERLKKPPEDSVILHSLLTPPQLAIITSAIDNFTFIQRPDAKYFEALEHISKQFVIGISADCCRGR